MPISASPSLVTLPDFRNQGFMLRTLAIVNLMDVAAALVRGVSWSDIWVQLQLISTVVQPVLLISLMVLYSFNHLLTRLKYGYALLAVLVIEAIISVLAWSYNAWLFGEDTLTDQLHWIMISLMVSAVLLGYFNLRSRAFSPALAEARLQALQARIRPHFLFNSINAVLSLIRVKPRDAETALEDLADLFRVLMSDNRTLVPIETELSLCRKYFDIEKLRLGERLQIEWNVNSLASEALIPPLVLQPLLENAVYHGIEPLDEGGEISIAISRRDDGRVHVTLTNPYHLKSTHHLGNKMALDNIRERMALHFDYEASLSAQVVQDRYQVDIIFPFRTS